MIIIQKYPAICSVHMRSEISASLAGIIPGKTTVYTFAAATGLDAKRASHAMRWWLDHGIGSKVDGVYVYELGERLEAGIKLLESGSDIETVASHLHWRDFEGLAGRILESEGYDVELNHIMTNPRMEIDVVGTRLDVAILVDCKHWRRSSMSAGVATKQEARARRWSHLHDMSSVPVIVTLLEVDQPAYRMPVVHISKFRSFATDVFGNMDGLYVIPEEW